MLTIAKFGGTSVGNANAIKQVATILQDNPTIKIVVLSAVSGVTNKLIEVFNQPANERREKCQHIISIHHNIIKELGLDHNEVLKLVEVLTDELLSLADFASTITHLDQMLSIGERLSSTIVAALLQKNGVKAKFYDARELIITDNHSGRAIPIIEDIKIQCGTKIKDLLNKNIIITQGFIGATKDGVTTTLGRGGSDYSAALFAEALSADLLEIYTDVKGVYSADPNLIPKARLIPKMSFVEMSELANFGAKVLHPATLLPCVRTNIPIMIKSTFAPKEGGTLIEKELQTSGPSITAIALRKEQVLLIIKSPHMVNTYGYLANIFGVLSLHKISVDVVTTSEVSVALTIDKVSLNAHNVSSFSHHTFVEELQSMAEVTIEENLTLLTLVGKGISRTLGVLQKILASIDSPIRLVSHGASHSNISLLVQSNHATKLMQHLHKIFLED